ncbi:hypothetical protein K438DRAFT_1975661 [Mycena galopus ATCC 62051]|nr:hypothetical protein K438DRAFT_1975661 [Mycena galopus ATCC 62051]
MSHQPALALARLVCPACKACIIASRVTCASGPRPPSQSATAARAAANLSHRPPSVLELAPERARPEPALLLPVGRTRSQSFELERE